MSAAYSGTNLTCESRDRLAKHAGHYARKSLWENLPRVKVWSEANRQFNDWISAVDINTDGEAFGNYGWHEGGTPCVAFRGKELWAKDAGLSPSAWEGPFMRVGLPFSGEAAYFNRLFGDRCYASNKAEDWCFGPGSIKVGTKSYRTQLTLDTSEMPVYGSPVSIEEEKGFWVFVPDGDGWKVFRDTFVTEEGHREIDTNRSLPWRSLKAR